MPLHPLRLAILIVCICWPPNRPALAQIGACPQTASEDIAAAPAERVGMRSGRLAEAIESLRGKGRDIHALVVLRNCKMVVEVYTEKVTREHNHALDALSAPEKRQTAFLGRFSRQDRRSSTRPGNCSTIARATPRSRVPFWPQRRQGWGGHGRPEHRPTGLQSAGQLPAASSHPINCSSCCHSPSRVPRMRRVAPASARIWRR